MNKNVKVLSMLKSLLKSTEGTSLLAIGLEDPNVADMVAEWVVRADRIVNAPEGKGGRLFARGDPELPVSRVQVIVHAPDCPNCQAEGPEVGILFDPVRVELSGVSLRGQEVTCRACGYKYNLVA